MSNYIQLDNSIKIQTKVGMLLKILKIKDKVDEIYNRNQLDFVKDILIEEIAEDYVIKKENNNN